MSIQAIRGGITPIGPQMIVDPGSGINGASLSAANAALIFVGELVTSDGASHTLDTTGSSAIFWQTDAITFSNGSTSVSVGVAAVDTATARPARAVNVANVITFDAKAVFAGGGGGITGTAMQTSVPTTGSKTMADGDQVAIAIQMTARGGTDSIIVRTLSAYGINIVPTVTQLSGAGSYSRNLAVPNVIIRFADGAYGWLKGSEVLSSVASRSWNSGSATKEYGQLYVPSVPLRVHGVYGMGTFTNNCDFILYSSPTSGSPVAERTVSMNAFTIATASGVFQKIFSSPYDVAAGQPIGIVAKPGASNISMYYKTLGNAAHRVSDVHGTDGYGISRASGAFANANSSLDHYYIGMLVSGLEAGSTSIIHPRSGLQGIEGGLVR